MKSCIGAIGSLLLSIIVFIFLVFLSITTLGFFIENNINPLVFYAVCAIIIFGVWFLYICVKGIAEDRIYKRVRGIREKYPKAYKQFTNKSGNHISEYTPSLESLKRVASRSNTTWEQEEKALEKQEIQQREIYQKQRKITSAYPNGLNHWRNLYPHKSIEETIASENEIKRFEEFYQKSQKYDSWEKEQAEFTQKSYTLSKEILPTFGKYVYCIPFDKTNIDGEKVAGTYKVWQHFPEELCLDEDLDYTLFPHWKQNIANIPQFKNTVLSFCQCIYENIIKFINELQKDGDILIYVNDDVPGWTKDSLYYHYVDLFASFDEKSMYAPILYEASMLKEVDWKSSLKRKIVIIDLMTENSHLKEICENITKEAKDKQPLITYISLFKCYSREEAQKLIDNKTKEKEEEERKRKEEEEQQKKQEEELRRKRMMLGAAESNRWSMVKDVRHYFFYYYYPTRFDDITEFDWDVRNLIWDFKDGKKHDEVCKMLTTKLKRVYGEALDLLTFVCIPASTREVNHKRYCSFMADVCNATGMENGYDYITIVKEKEPARLGGTSVAEYAYDKEFFNGRQIILFDDVVTRGRSLAKMKMELEGVGAHVVAALSIGRTYSDYYGDIREQHPWLEENEDYEIETI